MKRIGIKSELEFPQIYELGVWLIYVALYKYSYFLSFLPLAQGQRSLMPYPELMLYAMLVSAYLIPLYRILMPRFLAKKQYAWLLLITLLYMALVSKLSNVVVSFLFLSVRGTAHGLYDFYSQQLQIAMQQAGYLLAGWNLEMLITDLIAFSSIAFVRFAFESEKRRYALEKENLQLQFDVLKTQLQPHFLFNTLNSIYSLSLSGAAETPRFIMLLSEMMRHILYNSSKELVPLRDEILFLQNYVEMEQKRYPQASIALHVAADTDSKLQLPPLLLLPLLENSFKHGAHRLVDQAYVLAELRTERGNLVFSIENSVYEHPLVKQTAGGIGLSNIRQRLHLYYPQGHRLNITKRENLFKAELTLKTL